MSWELDSTFVGQYRGELESALSKWTPEQLAIAIANDDYAHNPRIEGKWITANKRWFREHSAKWFDGRKGYYLKFCAVDTLIDIVIERIEQTATTDNGAWAIWIDKGGCSKIDSSELDQVQSL